MATVLQLAAILVGVLLWVLGLRLFLRSDLSARRKITWTALLVAVGVGIGTLLPGPSILLKFVVLLGGLPLVAALDLALLRPARSLSFWLRACGYEVCTVFGVAGVARLALDRLAVPPLLGP
jgi:hypothetical protein